MTYIYTKKNAEFKDFFNDKAKAFIISKNLNIHIKKLDSTDGILVKEDFSNTSVFAKNYETYALIDHFSKTVFINKEDKLLDNILELRNQVVTDFINKGYKVEDSYLSNPEWFINQVL